MTFSYFFAELSKKALISFRSLRFAVVLRFRISEPGSNFKLRRVFLDFTLVDFWISETVLLRSVANFDTFLFTDLRLSFLKLFILFALLGPWIALSETTGFFIFERVDWETSLWSLYSSSITVNNFFDTFAFNFFSTLAMLCPVALVWPALGLLELALAAAVFGGVLCFVSLAFDCSFDLTPNKYLKILILSSLFQLLGAEMENFGSTFRIS